MNKTYIIAGVLSLGLLSCSKGFLEKAPRSNANVQAFYKNAADMEVALNAAYGTLKSFGQYDHAVWQMGEVRSDNTSNYEYGGNLPQAELDQFKETTSNAIYNSMWLDTYYGILLCNVVLDRIDPVEMDDNLKKRFIGEALFLRALMYFNLVRTFGDVPLVLKETTSVQEGYEQGRVAVNLVYEQIIADLKTAESNLPASYSGADIGRATSGAAKSILGKVYLTTQDFPAAANKLKEVVDASAYVLLPNYADLWKVENKNNAESIFEVQYKKGGTETGSWFNNQMAPGESGTYVTGIGFAFGRNLPTPDLIAAYEAGDIRKDASLAETYDADGTPVYNPYTLKFRDMPFADSDNDNNWPVIRYADVMLMYAEALNEVNNGPNAVAYNMVDQVRDRAGLAPLATGLSKADFAAAVAHERQVELAFEGHRWFDLVRTGKAIEVMNNHFGGSITVQPFQLVAPIPQTEININPSVIVQNTGY